MMKDDSTSADQQFIGNFYRFLLIKKIIVAGLDAAETLAQATAVLENADSTSWKPTALYIFFNMYFH